MSAAGLWDKVTKDIRDTVNGMVGRRRVIGFTDDGQVRTISLDPRERGEHALSVMRGVEIEVGDDVLTLKLAGVDMVIGALGRRNQGGFAHAGPIVPWVFFKDNGNEAPRASTPMTTTSIATPQKYMGWAVYLTEPGRYRFVLDVDAVMSRSANTGGMQCRILLNTLSSAGIIAHADHNISASNISISSRTQMFAQVSTDHLIIDEDGGFMNAEIHFTGLETAATTSIHYAMISGWYQRIA